MAAVCLLAGAGLMAREKAEPLPPEHVLHAADNRPRQVAALVREGAQPAARSLRLVAEARQVDGRPAAGLFTLDLPPGSQPPPAGHLFSARLRLRPITSFANPGGFDYQAFMAAKGLRARSYAGKDADLADQGPEPGGGHFWLEAVRRRLGALLDRMPPGQGRALVRSQVLGQRGELSGATNEAFAATGAIHIISISGLHMAMVWGLTYAALRLALASSQAAALRWPVPKIAALLALVPAGAYALVAEPSAPTYRAFIMAACLAAAMLCGRSALSLSSLALAALVIGLLWPGETLGVSFQLSFAAVTAIILAAAPAARWAQAAAGGRRRFRQILGGLIASAVIGLALWPLTVLHFHSLPLLSLPANALLVPLTEALLLPLALLGAAVGLAWPALGLLILEPARWAGEAAVFLAVWMAGLPGAVHYLAGPGPWAVALVYAAALAGLLLRGRPRWPMAGALAVLAAGVGLWQAQPPAPDGRLTAWVLDVGQGTAVALRLPQGQVLLVDGGGWPQSDFDFGQRVVAPFLWEQGFRRVEVVAASHRHPDHVGGLPFVARWFAPREIWTNGGAPDRGWYGRLLQAARQEGVPLRGPGDLPAEQEMGGARIRVVWPPAPPAGDADRGENDASLWLGVGLGRTWLWLPGDVGDWVEREVAPRLPEGRHALLAPHHGGKGTLTRELLERLRPEAVVFSAGCYNSFGHPRPEVAARAREAGAAAYNTAQSGCLTLVSDGEKWQVTPHLAQPRECAP